MKQIKMEMFLKGLEEMLQHVEQIDVVIKEKVEDVCLKKEKEIYMEIEQLEFSVGEVERRLNYTKLS